MAKSTEFYHGWIIRVSQEQIGYRFQCWMLDEKIGVTDYQLYPTCEQAFSAGRLRADLESLRLSLINFLRGKLQFLRLDVSERNALETSIDQYINAVKQQLS